MPNDIDFAESRALSEAVLVRMTPDLKKALDASAKQDGTSAPAFLRGLAAQSCRVMHENDLRKSAPRRTRRQIDKEGTDLRRLTRFIGNCALRLNEVAMECRKFVELDPGMARELEQTTKASLAKLEKLSMQVTSLIETMQQDT